ncbi:MAG: ABC transporter permease [Verrucomicrobiaceae bacterium]|nr:ABC transporter permease [Verrucomicrobiaceae bacterium]
MLPFAYAIRNLFRDPGRLLQKLGGVALVVFLLFAAGAFNEGMDGLLRGSGAPNNVIFLGAGSEESVERSEISADAESRIAAGVRGISTRAGVAAVSGEVHYMGLFDVAGKTGAQALMRGIRPAAFEVHREVRLVEGEYPRSGEVIVGRLAAHSLGLGEGELRPGTTLRFEGEELTVSGVFVAPGTVMESEIWMGLTDLMTLVLRDTLSCVVVRLETPDDFAEADLFAKQRLDLELVAMRETDYYAKLSEFFGPIRTMTWLTAALVATGAVFGGINVLYAAFSSRIRELATLQAVGYSRPAILLSLVQESLVSTLAGTLLASILAVAILEGVRVPFSMGTFQLTLSAPVLALGLGAALLLGTLGALPPAWRCLVAPIPVALRSR